jgi:hypothetical protein
MIHGERGSNTFTLTVDGYVMTVLDDQTMTVYLI